MRSSIATLASVFVGLVAANPVQSLAARALPVPTIGGYNYAGCFSEASTGKALADKTTYDDLMTNQKCAAYCVGYNWFGTEYGRECYCGQNFGSGGPVPEIKCSTSCPGDATQKCGAGRVLTTYGLPRWIPEPLTPRRFEYKGCYTEISGGRTLVGGSVASDAMTVAKCSETCIGFTYFGLEYGRECYCGDVIVAPSVLVAETECAVKCSGSAETCGGRARLSLYESIFDGNL